jgi:hypothetical protein
MVELWLQSNITDAWISVDVDNSLSISLNKSFEEIEDFTTRKSNFTKTFNIPQTKRNNDFFKSCFMVNSSNFQDAIVVNGVVKYGGADVFNGQLRLNKIINDANGGSYEVFMTETIPDLSINLQEIKLTDLDFTDLTHELNYDNIVSTWSYTGGSYSNYTGLTGTILYPLGHYGYDLNQYYTLFSAGTFGFTYSGSPLPTTQFAMWVNVKYLIDQMFNRIGFTYESDFFDTDYFTGLFALAKNTDTMGAKQVSGSTDNANVFRATDNRTYIDLADGNFDNAYFKGFILRNEVNDPLNIFSPSVSFQNRGHFFTTAVAGEYKFKFGFEAAVRFSYLPATYLNVAIKDVDDGTIYAKIEALTIFNLSSPTQYGDIYLNATIPAGRRVALYYSRNNGAGDPTAELYFNSAYWELWTSPIISTSQNVLLQDNLPQQASCLDFFKGIVEHFNLVVIPTGEKSVSIQSWNDYFSSGRVLDWSQKLDISSSYTLEPTNTLQKEYILEFRDSDDYLSWLNKNNRNQQFGTYRYIDTAPFHQGIITQTSFFQPLPISTYDNQTESNILIPHLYNWVSNASTIEGQAQPTGSELRLGWFQGMLDATIEGSPVDIWILSGITAVPHSTYPAISHLSSYEYSASTFSDLNYGNQYDFWQAPNDTYVGFTTHDVYNDFWAGRFAQLYEIDTKIFQGSFKLTPEEIKDIQFNDKVYFQEAYWRLYEMSDADITDLSLVECKFIKLPYDLSPVDLIPPTYEQSISPVIPTPTGTTYQHLFYSDTSTLFMCNETATIYPYWSNCSIISAGCSLYTTSGATTYVSEGTLVKETGSNTIYQVIEYGILTNLTTC